MNKVEKKQVLLEFIRLTRERLIARRKQKLRKRTRSNWPATASQPDLSPSRAKYFLVQSELHSWDHSSTEEKRLSYKCALHNTLMCNGVYSSGKSKIQENWIIILQKKRKEYIVLLRLHSREVRTINICVTQVQRSRRCDCELLFN